MKKTVLSLLALVFSCFTFAQEAGSEISYRQISADTTIYELTFKIYRYCSSTAITDISSNTSIRCSSSSTSTSLSPSLVSVTDVTSLCGRIGRCSPPNTFGGGAGFEELIFKDTIDFSVWPYSNYNNCSETLIEFSACCRTSNLTTIGTSNMYNYASIFFQNFPQNTSSYSESIPLTSTVLNNPVRATNKQINADGDSLSFAFSQAKTSFTSNATYSGNYDYNQPVGVYYPGALSFPYANRSAIPPIGMTLDNMTGDLFFTPVTQNEVAVMVIETTEWRADSNGIRKKAGITRKEFNTSTLSLPDNTIPLLQNFPTSINLCIGEPNRIDFLATDFVFVPPPPLPSIDPDTLEVTYYSDYPIEFVLDSQTYSNKTQLYGHFKFNTDSFPTIPDDFDIVVTVFEKNRCYGFNSVSKRVNVKLFPQPELSTDIDVLACGAVKFSAQTDTFNGLPPSINYQVLNSNDSLVYFGNGANGNDTFVLREAGTYSIKTTATFGLACDSVTYDTFAIQSDDAYTMPSLDTFLVCYSDSFQLSIDSKWQQGIWSTGDTSHAITVVSPGQYTVDMYDSCGIISTHTFRIGFRSFEIDFKDTAICPTGKAEYVIDPIPGISWNWSGGSTAKIFTTSVDAGHSILVFDSVCNQLIDDNFNVDHIELPKALINENEVIRCDNGAAIATTDTSGAFSYLWDSGSTSDTAYLNTAGYRYLEVNNECGTDKDSVLVIQKYTPVLNLGPDLIICEGDEDTILINRDAEYTYQWDDSSTDTSRIVSMERDYWCTATNVCGSKSDTVYLYTLNLPTVELGKDTVKPEFDIITLRNLTPTPFVSSLWSIGSNGDSLQVRLAGDYWLEETNVCGSVSDTIRVTYVGSVKETELLGFNVYPNPASEYIKIENQNGKSFEYVMFNLQGKIVMMGNSNNPETQIQLGEIARGQYILELTVEKKTSATSVIIR